MRFTVTWCPSALAALAEIWMQASDKQSVTQAANLIDHGLGTSPEKQGKGTDEQRFWPVYPLLVHYRISRLDCLVEVIRVISLVKKGMK